MENKKVTEEKLSGIKLLRDLCLTFGPTGCEEAVADEICRQLEGTTDAEITRVRCGNVYAVLHGETKNGETAKKVMLSAHTDEVGFIINEIDSDGYLKFSCEGGIDPRVLCGRHVTFRGKDGDVAGVIASKAIHHQTADERKTATKVKDMYVDIGAKNKEDAEKYVAVGVWGTFDSDFVVFGENDRYMKGKAIDDRLGCAVIIETLRRLKAEGKRLPFDLYCAFTVREEIGRSGAQIAAQTFEPDYAIVLESTAIADLPDVPANSRVAKVGDGGVISLADRSTVYDREFVDGTMKIAAQKNIPAQIKRYVSGGNDAGHIHKAARGTKTLAVSAPTRYLHSASCVAAAADFDSIRELIYAVLNGYSF
ncbi:MAG: M20/M25/M40 family metallo-hydrolase [Clostridia bacterium]|nr:M20/M25/M40 family metallo-hydrolase [Clostridia bacterium]